MKKNSIKDVIDELIYEAIIGKNPFKVGDLVRLRPDVLNGAGPNIQWRDTLKQLLGKIGKISRVFPNSKHVNVKYSQSWKSKDERGKDYSVDTIGVNYTQLIPANDPEKELGEGYGWGYTKDIKKDPKHTTNKTTGKVQRWTVKFQSAGDLKKHGNTEKSTVNETLNFSEIKNAVKEILNEEDPIPQKEYIIWAKSGPVPVYYVDSPTQGQRMVQFGQSMATRFPNEEKVRNKILQLKQKYPGIKKWDFEIVGPKTGESVWKPHGPKEFELGHQVFKPVKKVDEWIVRWVTNGKTDKDKTYFTDNLKDANDTYGLMNYNAFMLNKKAKEGLTELSTLDNLPRNNEWRKTGQKVIAKAHDGKTQFEVKAILVGQTKDGKAIIKVTEGTHKNKVAEVGWEYVKPDNSI